jgi:predicted AAA+ superfamily ATPase
LARHLASREHPSRYLTLDDAVVLSAAGHDAAGFLAELKGPVILDEAQRAPELFLAIKAQVDRSPQPGRFLLTGSADVLLLPQVSEALAGRMEILTLWPFSQAEISGTPANFLDALLAGSLHPFADPAEDGPGLRARLLLGGYPSVLSRSTPERRRAWFGAYITSILQRDVRDLAHIEGLTALPRLLSLLAARSCSLLNFAELSRSTAIPQSTLKRYFTLLETTFLVQLLPAWSSNLGKRLVKSPKVLLNDTGLSAYLLGLSEERLETDPALMGALLENFVAMEVRKQMGWSQTHLQAFHFRLQAGPEVDLVLEDAAGNIVGIEVKAKATVTARDFSGLQTLAEVTGRRFRRGVVLYTGSTSVSFSPNLHALPVNALWSLPRPL